METALDFSRGNLTGAGPRGAPFRETAPSAFWSSELKCSILVVIRILDIISFERTFGASMSGK
jgi:hypothetical protein